MLWASRKKIIAKATVKSNFQFRTAGAFGLQGSAYSSQSSSGLLLCNVRRMPRGCHSYVSSFFAPPFKVCRLLSNSV